MEIRLFRINEIELLMKSIDQLWAKNHILSRDVNLLKYMFYDNPNRDLITDKEHLTFLGAWIDGQVIGLLGVMPFIFNDRGKKGLACTLANWIVHPEYRTSGAGLALINYVQNFKPSMILAMGLSDEAAKLYKLMRWSYIEDVPRWIGILNKNIVVKTLLNGDSSPLRYVSSLQEVEVLSMDTCEEVFELDEESWNQFLTKHFANNTLGVNRDYTFLNWRYFSHPSFEYRKFVCRNDNEINGLMIVRIELIQGKYKIGRIVEFIASDQDSSILLANKLISLDPEILFFDFYCFSSVSTWGLENIGFKRVFNSNKDPYMLPTRFQPVDFSNTKLGAAMFISEKQINKLNHLADQMWYLTKGDADQDRPN